MSTTSASRPPVLTPDATDPRSTGSITAPGGRRRHQQGSVQHPRDTTVKRTLYAIAGIGSALVFGVPLIWSILRAFQSEAVITSAADPATFFRLGWENFAAVFGSSSHLLTGVLNSVIVSVSTAVLTAILATMAGYGFARFRFRGSGLVFGLVLLTMMVPFQAILTPLYLEMNALGLTNSLFGLVLFYTTVNLPFGVFVMRNAFESIPPDLEDSAFVDGASRFRVVVSVLRPLLLPGAATAALYAFLASWTEFLGALTFLTKDSLYTLPVALLNLQTGAYGQVSYGNLVAGSVVAMIPCIALYVGLQRFYVAGLSSGALKG
jgi:multiple sugar transport system permease protein